MPAASTRSARPSVSAGADQARAIKSVRALAFREAPLAASVVETAAAWPAGPGVVTSRYGDMDMLELLSSAGSAGGSRVTAPETQSRSAAETISSRCFSTSRSAKKKARRVTVAALQSILSPWGHLLADISERRTSWRHGHGWTRKLCGRSHRRCHAGRGPSPASDRQAVAELPATPLSPLRTPGVSASDGPSDSARLGRSDGRAAPPVGCDLLATSLSCLRTLFQCRPA